MKKIELVCSGCGVSFEKEKKEHDRQLRKGKTAFYCTRQCFGKYVAPKNANTSAAIAWRNSKEWKEWQKVNAQKQKDKADPFRVYLRMMKGRRPTLGVDLEYLKKLWEDQRGRCAYSGLILQHPRWTATDGLRTASIDRIDSSQGYVEGNIQFVVRALNLAKNIAGDQDFRKFLDDLVGSLTSVNNCPKYGTDATANPKGRSETSIK